MKTRVAILSGFLGYGKTTILNKILKTAKIKIAVIVNDLGDINVDAELIKAEVSENIIELHNGCICCTINDEFYIELLNLSKSGFDYIIVESSGVSEPLLVAQTFEAKSKENNELKDSLLLDNLITVVDVRSFSNDLFSNPTRSENDNYKDISKLLIEQIEFSNTIILSKIDTVDDSTTDEVLRIIRSLNSTSVVVKYKKEDINLSDILYTNLFSIESVRSSPRWISALENQISSSELDEYGISAHTYRARRPFDGKKFLNFIQSKWNFGKIFRSKGFFWVSENPDEIWLLNMAGPSVKIEHAGKWWNSIPSSDRPKDKKYLQLMERHSQFPHYDCRQELVFIGQNINIEHLNESLNKCLMDEVRFNDNSNTWSSSDSSDIFAID